MDEGANEVMTSERDQILSRARKALVPLQQRSALPKWDSELIRLRQAAARGDPWDLFSKRLAAVHGIPMTNVADLVAILHKHNRCRGYCDPRLWHYFRAHFPARLDVDSIYDRARVDIYDFGITAAAGAIAETGTIILTDGSTSSRLAALTPWVHVAVIRRENIHADISTALDALSIDPNVIWVTGPSKTADVEGILIEGVHGPGIQIALLLPDEEILERDFASLRESAHINLPAEGGPFDRAFAD